jgi:multicomponent Na+:H+ antiporter subunit B
MNSLILRTSARLVLTLLLIFSIFLLLRGHNDPGGGFVGGLVAAAAFALYGVADGTAATRRALYLDPRTIIAIGLLIAAGTGAAALFVGDPFLTAGWGDLDFPGLPSLTLGTPLLFDAGVFLVVLGVTQTIILALAEE